MKNLILCRFDSWKMAVVKPSATIKEVLQVINNASIKFALVCSGDFVLLGTVSDGDVRRGLLRGISLDELVSVIMNPNPLVTHEGVSQDLVYELMVNNQVYEIPELNVDSRVVGLRLLRAPSHKKCDHTIVIMAGGRGARLLHHTESCPKPMLEVGGRPMLEHIILKAKNEGFRDIVLSVNYLSHVIENYFEDGNKFGVSIKYLKEDSPLGTAGALSLFEKVPKLPFLVTNGDVLTEISYRDILDFHIVNHAHATMAVRPYEWKHPFGVVEISDFEIVGFQEKPVMRSNINAGVYVLNPSTLKYLKKNEYCDMPAIFEALKSDFQKIIAYPVHEKWQDIGNPNDLRIANE